MRKRINKSRWYDGVFYGITVDPIAGKSFAKPIAHYVAEGSSAIDIGCGVGSVVAELSKKCSLVTGVDLSVKMVNVARKRLTAASIRNVDILLASAADLASRIGRTYDYAIMTQFLHEISPELRIRIMDDIKKIAREFIIADFISPYPNTLSGTMIRLIEMAAGKEHNANFGDWIARGGLDGFLRDQGMAVIDEHLFSTGVGKIVKAKMR